MRLLRACASALDINDPFLRKIKGIYMRSLFGAPGRSVVVTEAGRGLGREIALELAKQRSIVFGTAESAREAKEMRRASSGRVSLIVCDLEKTNMVNAWAAGVSEAIGVSGLDLLISTAGHLEPGPLEILPLEEIRRGFETSVFGRLAIINAFLPALRMAQGRIIQISGWTPEVAFSFEGPSSASQAAMEAFSVAYRAELEPFGIDVVIASVREIEAATLGSPVSLERIDNRISATQRRLYGKQLAACLEKSPVVKDNHDLAMIAQGVVDLAMQSQVPLKVAMDRGA